MPNGPGLRKEDGRLDLNVTGNTPRAFKDASMAVLYRSSTPQRPAEDETLALTSRSKGRWKHEQEALTRALTQSYGKAGGGMTTARGAGKKLDMQAESTAANNAVDEVRKTEYIPKVRETVRALQETLRLKRLAASNPKLLMAGQQADARDALNGRQEAAINRLQAAARGLSARREAKNRLSMFRARKTVNAMAARNGWNLRVPERVI